MSDSEDDFDGRLRVGGHREEIQAASQAVPRPQEKTVAEHSARDFDSAAADRIRAEIQRSENRILTAMEEAGAARHDEMAYINNEIQELKKTLDGSKSIANFAYFWLIFFAVTVLYLLKYPAVIEDIARFVMGLFR